MKRLGKEDRKYGVHMSHCNLGEYRFCCKYGEDLICPALDMPDIRAIAALREKSSEVADMVEQVLQDDRLRPEVRLDQVIGWLQMAKDEIAIQKGVKDE